jgi:hypothetical protein
MGGDLGKSELNRADGVSTSETRVLDVVHEQHSSMSLTRLWRSGKRYLREVWSKAQGTAGSPWLEPRLFGGNLRYWSNPYFAIGKRSPGGRTANGGDAGRRIRRDRSRTSKGCLGGLPDSQNSPQIDRRHLSVDGKSKVVDGVKTHR